MGRQNKKLKKVKKASQLGQIENISQIPSQLAQNQPQSRKKDRSKKRKARNSNKFSDRSHLDNTESTSPSELASQLATYVSYANDRIDQILASGYYSNAVQRVYDEIGSYHFPILQNPTKQQAIKLSTQINVFLTSQDSTVTGAELSNKEMSRAFYKENHLFGKQENPHWMYNVEKLDYAKAKLAFAVYREIESTRAGAIYGESKLAYGSENLIIDIYDMIQNQGIQDMSELVRKFQDEIDSFISKANDELNFRIRDTENINMIAGTQVLKRGDDDYVSSNYF